MRRQEEGQGFKCETRIKRESVVIARRKTVSTKSFGMMSFNCSLVVVRRRNKDGPDADSKWIERIDMKELAPNRVRQRLINLFVCCPCLCLSMDNNRESRHFDHLHRSWWLDAWLTCRLLVTISTDKWSGKWSILEVKGWAEIYKQSQVADTLEPEQLSKHLLGFPFFRNNSAESDRERDKAGQMCSAKKVSCIMAKMKSKVIWTRIVDRVSRMQEVLRCTYGLSGMTFICYHVTRTVSSWLPAPMQILSNTLKTWTIVTEASGEPFDARLTRSVALWRKQRRPILTLNFAKPPLTMNLSQVQLLYCDFSVEHAPRFRWFSFSLFRQTHTRAMEDTRNVCRNMLSKEIFAFYVSSALQERSKW